MTYEEQIERIKRYEREIVEFKREMRVKYGREVAEEAKDCVGHLLMIRQFFGSGESHMAFIDPDTKEPCSKRAECAVEVLSHFAVVAVIDVQVCREAHHVYARIG